MTQRRPLRHFFLSPILLSLVVGAPFMEASGKKKKKHKQQAKKVAAQAKSAAPPGPAVATKAGAGAAVAKPQPKQPAAGARPPAVETKATPGGPGNPLTKAVMDGFKDLPPEVVRAILETATPKTRPLDWKTPEKLEKALTARLLLARPDLDRAAAVAELQRKLQAGLPVKDFAGLDLRGSNLDLSGGDLTRADFYRARLGSVDFRGASVKDARFFRADIRGAKNLDLSGAQLHPFFQRVAGEPVGTIRTVRLLGLGPASADQQDRILLTRDRLLVWIRDDGPGLRVLAPTGWSFDMVFEADLRCLAIKEDPEGRIYLFTDQGVHLIPTGQLLQGGKDWSTQVFPGPKLTRPPRGIGFTSNANTVFFQNGEMHVMNPRDMSHSPGDAEALGAGGDQVGLLALHSTLLILRDQRPDVIMVTDLEQGLTYHLQVEGGLHDLAKGSGDTFHGTLQGIGHLIKLTIKKGKDEGPPDLTNKVIPLDPLANGPRQPTSIAPGEDGNFWFTDPGVPCIGRVTADGKVEDFLLRAGDRPLRIFPSWDGRMLFTLEGQNRLGSIRTVAVPGMVEAPEAVREAEEKEDAGLAGEIRAATFDPIHQEDFRETEAEAEANATPEGTPDGKAVTPDGRVEAALEGKAGAPADWIPPAPNLRRGTALRRMHERGYHLSEDLAALILGKHKLKEDPEPAPARDSLGPIEFRRFQGKSQFSPGVKTAADLAELLAEGLAGEVTFEESDVPGREHWTFTLPGAGRVHAMSAYGPWKPSDKVRVITRLEPGPRNTSRRFIINAFPVRP